MMKRLLLLSLLMISATVFPQKILINGVERNGKLQWDDFPVTDDSHAYDSYVWYDFEYNIQRFKLEKNIVVPESVIGVLKFNSTKSWVRPGAQNDENLERMQGHFNIGILTIKEIVQELKKMRFQQNEKAAKEAIESKVELIKMKYKAVAQNYDMETKDPQDKENKEKWDSYFRAELPELYHKRAGTP